LVARSCSKQNGEVHETRRASNADRGGKGGVRDRLESNRRGVITLG